MLNCQPSGREKLRLLAGAGLVNEPYDGDMHVRD